MAEAGKSVGTGGGGQPGVSPAIQGSDPGGPDVWVGVLGAVRCDDAGDVRIPCGFFKADHWEAGKVSGRRDLGDTGGGGGHKEDGEKVGFWLHWTPAGNGGAVGGHTPTPRVLYEGNGLHGDRVGRKGRGGGSERPRRQCVTHWMRQYGGGGNGTVI